MASVITRWPWGKSVAGCSQLFPDALIVSIGGAEPCGPPPGRQWFSVQGVSEENRQQRVDAIMPTFIETVRYWQQQSGVSPQATRDGFSQGAIMSLESIKAEPGLASRVIAFNGRYATLPETATTATTVHLIHGGEDRVIDLAWAVAGQEALQQAGGDVTLDIVKDLGHAIDDRSMRLPSIICALPYRSTISTNPQRQHAKDSDIIELL